MKRCVLAFIVCGAAVAALWCFFCHSRIGVGIRVLCQMAFPPKGLYANKVEVPIQTDVLDYEISATNRFIGCYAVRIDVPINVREGATFLCEPPVIKYVNLKTAVGFWRHVNKFTRSHGDTEFC